MVRSTIVQGETWSIATALPHSKDSVEDIWASDLEVSSVCRFSQHVLVEGDQRKDPEHAVRTTYQFWPGRTFVSVVCRFTIKSNNCIVKRAKSLAIRKCFKANIIYSVPYAPAFPGV